MCQIQGNLVRERVIKMFKEILKEKHITQIQLAKQLGVTQAAVSLWIRGGDKPRLDKIYKIAKILDIPADKMIEIFFNLNGA